MSYCAAAPMQFQRTALKFIVPVLIASACGKKTAPASGSGSGSGSASPVVVDQDYKVRADQYAAKCNAGCGDAEACHQVLLLAVRERGVVDGQGTLQLAATMCSKDDKLGCLIQVLVGIESVAKLGDPVATRAACVDHQDKRACEIAIAMAAVQGSANDQAIAELDAAACKAGLADGCDDQIKRLGSAAPKPLVDQVTAACAAGDADACAAVGKKLDDKELCGRHDYAACERIGDVAAFTGTGSDAKAQRLRDVAKMLPPIVKGCAEKDEAACTLLARFSKPKACN